MRSFRFILFFFMVFLNPIICQVDWAPVGAEWNYSIFNSYEQNSEAWIQLKAIGSTNILGKDCTEMLSATKYFDGVESEETWYSYNSNDTIYYYRPNKFDQFEILYDFSAQIGDTVTFFGYPNTDNLAIVDSISILIVNGQELRELHLTDEWEQKYGSYIEKIGSRFDIFPVNNFTTDGFDHIYLRCYDDSNLSYRLVEDCQFWGTISSINEIETDQYLIFPNPAQDYTELVINKEVDQLRYEIFNELGQLEQNGWAYQGNNIIPLDLMPNGNYWIVLKGKQGETEIISLVILKP